MATKQYYGVAAGRQPGIYNSWSHANTQVDGFPSACYRGFEHLSECVDFMIAKGDFSVDNIKVFGERGGQYSLKSWQRKVGTRESQDSSDN